MKKRVAKPADEAADLFDTLLLGWNFWQIRGRVERRNFVVRLASALDDVRGALAAQLPDDEEAAE